jgi:TM2 domain-containing membrane protein YozV
MFCRNCGQEIADNAAVCVHCGVSVGQAAKYCPNCGAETQENAVVCTKCGVALSKPVPAGEQKSKLTAGLLGIFLGGLGIHNFYLGYTGKGIAQICLSFCFGAGYIWGLVEGIMILTGAINKDAKGVPLKD